MARWRPVYFYFPLFWNLVHYVTKQGVPVPSSPWGFRLDFLLPSCCLWLSPSSLCNVEQDSMLLPSLGQLLQVLEYNLVSRLIFGIDLHQCWDLMKVGTLW
jgi:hypothetical protein